jgi:hypothetical protein
MQILDGVSSKLLLPSEERRGDDYGANQPQLEL